MERATTADIMAGAFKVSYGIRTSGASIMSRSKRRLALESKGLRKKEERESREREGKEKIDAINKCKFAYRRIWQGGHHGKSGSHNQWRGRRIHCKFKNSWYSRKASFSASVIILKLDGLSQRNR